MAPTSGDDGPTLGEVVRRLEDVARQLAALTTKLDETYLRRDVYEVQRNADTGVMEGLRTDLDAIVEQQRQNRRVALTGLMLPILTTIIAALILAAVLPS